MTTELALQVFATLFVVIDPPGLVPMFLVLTHGQEDRHRMKIALRAIAVAGAILLPFALLGEPIFRFLGVSLPAFRIAGGLLLFLISVDMLFEKRTARREQKVTESQAGEDGADDVSVFPLGTPLIAGPGTIASIILLMGEHRDDIVAQTIVLSVLFGTLALTLSLFLVAAKLHRFISPTITKVITRVFGIILSALAVQFVLTGLKNAGVIP